MVENVIIGNDHGGYQAKVEIVELLEEMGIEVEDIGSESEEIVRYPNYARKVAGAVARGEYDRGILVCSTGIGMSIAANKVKGVRAALVTSTYMARLTREHNDSNVLCLGGKTTGIYEILDYVRTWIETEYTGGRHDISLGLISDLEEEVGTGIPEEDNED
ncbi:MAG: ribose 5-phosphate isomerase B [Candidatus Brocadiia bacterium]